MTWPSNSNTYVSHNIFYALLLSCSPITGGHKWSAEQACCVGPRALHAGGQSGPQQVYNEIGRQPRGPRPSAQVCGVLQEDGRLGGGRRRAASPREVLKVQGAQAGRQWLDASNHHHWASALLSGQ
jgi:hypothetical protein